jgi:hypothetical protein
METCDASLFQVFKQDDCGSAEAFSILEYCYMQAGRTSFWKQVRSVSTAAGQSCARPAADGQAPPMSGRRRTFVSQPFFSQQLDLRSGVAN